MSCEIIIGDCLDSLTMMQSGSVQCCVTSPPYFGLRDYGHPGQIGLEETPEQYISKLVEVFREVRRVLKNDGTLWLNIGDSYNANRSYQVPSTKGGPKHSDSQAVGGKGSKVHEGMKPKDLIGIPWMLAFALRADGWYLRQDIIWSKPNPMPESVTDRCTKSHEYVFLLSKSERYFFDHEAIKEPSNGWPIGGAKKRGTTEYAMTSGKKKTPQQDSHEKLGSDGVTRNKRSVWIVSTKPYKGAHFATFPPDLITPCIKAGTKPGDTVIDPFGGSGTTGQVALAHGRKAILCELNPDYKPLIEKRTGEANSAITMEDF